MRFPKGLLSERQPRRKGLLWIQNGGLEKTLANSRSRFLKLANHKARCRFETVKSPIFLETRDLLLPGSSPSRHFERREDPGDEVGRKANLELKAIKKLSKTCHKLIKNFAVQRAAVTAEGSFYSFVSGDSTLEFGGGGNTWEIYGIYTQQLTYIFR